MLAGAQNSALSSGVPWSTHSSDLTRLRSFLISCELVSCTQHSGQAAARSYEPREMPRLIKTDLNKCCVDIVTRKVTWHWWAGQSIWSEHHLELLTLSPVAVTKCQVSHSVSTFSQLYAGHATDAYTRALSNLIQPFSLLLKGMFISVNVSRWHVNIFFERYKSCTLRGWVWTVCIRRLIILWVSALGKTKIFAWRKDWRRNGTNYSNAVC